jgi:hypothetical protein
MKMRRVVRAGGACPKDGHVAPVTRCGQAAHGHDRSIDADRGAGERLDDRDLGLASSIAPARRPVRCRLAVRTASHEMAPMVQPIGRRTTQRERQNDYRDETPHAEVESTLTQFPRHQRIAPRVTVRLKADTTC